MTGLRNTGGKEAGPQEFPIPHIDVSRNRIEMFCKRWRITELAVFGSVLRDDFGSDSDVDVDVLFRSEPDARPTLIDMVHMEEELSAIFGWNVRLTMRNAIENSRNYIRRKDVLETAQVVYAA